MPTPPKPPQSPIVGRICADLAEQAEAQESQRHRVSLEALLVVLRGLPLPEITGRQTEREVDRVKRKLERLAGELVGLVAEELPPGVAAAFLLQVAASVVDVHQLDRSPFAQLAGHALAEPRGAGRFTQAELARLACELVREGS